MFRASMSSSSGRPPRFIVLGNPRSKRVELFNAALARRGLPAAQVLPWLDWIGGRLSERLFAQHNGWRGLRDGPGGGAGSRGTFRPEAGIREVGCLWLGLPNLELGLLWLILSRLKTAIYLQGCRAWKSFFFSFLFLALEPIPSLFLFKSL